MSKDEPRELDIPIGELPTPRAIEILGSNVNRLIRKAEEAERMIRDLGQTIGKISRATKLLSDRLEAIEDRMGPITHTEMTRAQRAKEDREGVETGNDEQDAGGVPEGLPDLDKSPLNEDGNPPDGEGL